MSKQLNVSLAFTANTNEAIAAIKKLQKELNGLATGSALKDSGISQITPEIQRAMVAAGELQAKLEAATNLKTGKLDLGQFSDSLKKGGVSLQQYANQLNALGPAGRQAFTNLAQSVLQAEAPLIRCSQRVKELGTTLANTARWQLSSSILHGFMGAISSAYGYAQDLNESLNNIRIVTGASIAEMDQFAAKANKAARALSTTTNEYAKASLIYFQQGDTQTQAMEKAAVTAKMANVTGQSAEAVSNQLTAIWNNFNKEGDVAYEHYADVLTKLGAATASSTDEIAGGLEKFAGIADTIGLSYEYAASALATITATSRESEEVVGTALKTIFARIQGLQQGDALEDGTTLNKYSEALQKVGISIFDQTGELKNMDSILEEMAAKWVTLGKDQQLALAQTVAGVRQYNQMVTLMDNWNFMEENLATAGTADGELNKQAEIYAESWEAARDRARAAAEELYTKLLDDDFFIGFLNGIEKAIDGISGLVDAFGGLRGALATIGAYVTRIFQKEMAQGLRTAAQNIKGFINPKGVQAEQDAKKAEAIKALSSMKSTASGAEREAEDAALEREVRMQKRLQSVAKTISEEEAKQLQIQMDNVRAMDKRAIAAAKVADAVREEAEELEETTRAYARIEARDKARAERKDAEEKARTDGAEKIVAKLVPAKQDEKASPHSKRGFLKDQYNKAVTSVKSEMGADIDIKAPEIQKKIRQAFINGVNAAAEDGSDPVAQRFAKSYQQQITEAGQKAVNAIAKETEATIAKAEADAIDAVAKLTAGVDAATGTKVRAKDLDATFTRMSTKDVDGETKNTQQLIKLNQTLATKIEAAKEEAIKLQGALGGVGKDTGLDDAINELTSIQADLEEAGIDAKKLDAVLARLGEKQGAKGTVTDQLNESAGHLGREIAGKYFGESGPNTRAEEYYQASKKKISEQVRKENYQADADGAEEEMGDSFDKANQKTQDWADGIANATNTIMSLGSAITSVQGAIDVFNDPDATGWDKVSAIISVIIGVLPVATGLYQMFGTTAAAAGEAAGAGMTAALGPIGGITLAVTALIAAFVLLADVAHAASPAGQFEAASEAAEQAASTADQVRAEYDALNQSLNALDSGIEAIHEMERGTIEWRAAIADANAELIELLSTYDMLNPENFTTDADGLMQITDEAKAELLNRQQNAVREADNANYMAQVNKNNADSRLKASEGAGTGISVMRTQTTKDGQTFTYDAVEKGSHLSADIGQAIATAMRSGALTNMSDKDSIIAALESVAGLTEAEAQSVADQIASNAELQVSMLELGNAINNNTEANRILNNQIVENAFGEKIDEAAPGMTDAQQEQVKNMIGTDLEALTNELYESTYKDKGLLGAGMTDEEVQKQYAESMGWATNTIEDQSGNKAKYYAKDGTEIGVRSDEEARKHLAQQEAIRRMGGDVQNYVDTLNDLITTGDKIGAGIGEALGSFAGGQQGDFSSFTEKDVNQFKSSMTDVQKDKNDKVTSFKIGDLEINEEYAKKLGYDSVNAYYNAIQAELNATKENLNTDKLVEDMGLTTVVNGVEKTFNTAGESFEKLMSTEGLDFDAMTAGSKKAFADAYKSIFEAGGEEALGMVDGVIASAGDQASEMATLIAETDWSDWDSTEAFAAKMEKMGISIEGFDVENFVKQMQSVHNTVKEFNLDNFREEFASINKLVSDLEFGSIISEEDFKSLGEGYESYFTMMADGTYKLTGDAEQFYNAVMQNQRKDLLDSIEAGKANIANDNKTLTAAQATMGSLNSSNIGSTEVQKTKDGSLNTDNINSQIGFIETMGGSSVEQIKAWKEELSDGQAPIETLQAIANAAGECSIKFGQMAEGISADEAALQNAVQAIFTTATSLNDLHNIADQVSATMGDSAINQEYYAAGLINLGTQYGNCTDEIREYQAVLNSGNDALIDEKQHQLETAVAIGESADQYGLEAEVLEDAADGFLKVAEAGKEEYQILKDDAEALKDASVRYVRLNEAVLDLADNYDDYAKVLKDISESTDEVDKAMIANSKSGKALQKSLAGLLGTSEDMIDADLLSAIDPKDFEKAAKGDEKAIGRIRDAFIELQAEANGIDVSGLKEELAGLEEGAIIDINANEMPLLHKLIEAKLAAGAGAAEIEALLSGLNIDADVSEFNGSMNEMIEASRKAGTEVIANTSFSQDVETVTAETPVTKEDVGFTETVTAEPRVRFSRILKDGDEELTTVPEVYYEWKKSVVPNVESETGTSEEVGTSITTSNGAGQSGQVKGVTIKNAHKSSGGKVGGSTRKSASGGGKGGGGKGKGGKGGGGGGGGAKEKPTADARGKKKDIVDRYKEINDKLEETNRLLEKNNVEADALWGAKRIAALKNGVKLLEQENKQLKEKYELSKTYLKEDVDALHQAAADAGISFTIDDVSGNIINYTDAMTQLFNERERLLDSFGSTMSESEEERLTAFDDKIEKVKESYEQYEKTLDEKLDLEQEQIQKTAEIQQQYYDILSEELEIKITINDNDLKLLEYHLGRIEDDFYNMAEAAAIMIDSSNSLGMSQMDIYSNNLADYSNHLKKLEENYAAGKISQASYIEGLQDVQDNIISNLESLNDLDDAMMEYYGNTLDMAIEEIAKYTDQMDHLVSILDHYQSLMEIMGKENNYAAIGVILEGRAKLLEDQVAISKSTMEMLKNEAADRYQAYQEALESGNDAAAKVYLKQYEDALAAANEAEDEFLSQAEDWADSLKAILENKLKGLNKTLEEALTGGTSFDSLNTAMERAESLQEEYLTTTNKIYETNKLMRKAQQEIDKTTNSVAKKRLQEFITETDQLQDKAKLSKFELDIQQAKYDLLLAEIALQEAQNAKSTVRLQKDSEGNFGYVYTADENLMAEAEQTLLDKQNNLYNLSLDGANEYKEKYIQTLNEMYDTLADLQQQKMDGMFASEEEYQQAVAEATQFYYEQLEQYADLHGVAIVTDGRVINEAWSADFADMVQDTAVWKDAVDGYLTGAEEAFNQWVDGIGKVAEAVGIPLDQIGNSVKDVTDGFAKLRDEVNNVTDESTQLKNALDGKGGIIDTVQSEIAAVKSIAEKYANLREELGRVKKSYEDLMATINATIKAQANLTNASTSSTSKGNSGTTSSTGKSNTNQSSSTSSNGSTKGSNGSTRGSNGSTRDSDKPKGTNVTIKVSKNPHVDGSAGTMTFKNKVDRYWNNKGTQLPYSFKLNGQEYYISANSHQKLSDVGFDTGGYTGQWGPSGKWAMLHEKELVLNKKDTENFLASMDILDKIVSVIDLHSANAQLGGLLSTPQYSGFKDNQVLEQNVRIEASFPNATNHNEIEEAFNNLINTASQYANRK